MIKLTANYHTHTWRCNHATGTERTYVEAAIATGIRFLGFSDHSPYLFDGDYYSGFRMRPEQLEDYVQTVRSLQMEYAADIEIRLGLETEYYPALFSRLLDFLVPYQLDYMILGQHFTNNETDGSYVGALTTPEGLEVYVNQVCDAMKTGLFSCFNHPDLAPVLSDTVAYRELMTRLCLCAKAENVPLEINLLGIRDSRAYPCEAFFTIAGEVGNQVVLGLDAHNVEAIADKPSLEQAEELVMRTGVLLIDQMELRQIRK